MKLLLADDERSIRDYLRTLIDWEAHGYTLLEAENGLVALELIKKHDINLVLMDISMPVMSGLQALEEIKKGKSGCIVTLLTCHDEFEYAQQALKLGCFDYALKGDISAESILLMVAKMKNALSDELRARQYKEEIAAALTSRTRQELQSAFGYWLQSGNAPENSMAMHLSQNLGISSENLRYVLLNLVITDYSRAISRYTGSNALQFTEVFDGVMRELLVDHSFIYAQPQNGSFFILLWFEKQISTQCVISSVQEVTQKISSSFHTILDIDVRLVYSLPFWSMEHSRELYFSMCRLDELTFFGKPETLSCVQDYNLEPQEGAELLQELQATVKQELATRNLSQIEQAISACASKVQQKHIFVSPTDFISVCKRCITDWLSPDDNANADWQAWSNVEDITALLAAMQSTIASHCLTQDSTDKKNIVKKALLIIQQSYSDQVSLESISKQLFVNPSYLSHLFSEEMGLPITAYVNSYRIEQAKKLITSSNFKLYEIAKKSGFSSPIVFSTCFKKITGETPTEYKNRLF